MEKQNIFDDIFGVFDECAYRQTPMGMIDEQVENIYRTYDRNALEVLGGAALAYRDMHEDGEGRDITKIIPHLDRCMRMAFSVGWYAGVAEAMRAFCNLCMVDPALVEALLGHRFEQIVTMYSERVCAQHG